MKFDKKKFLRKKFKLIDTLLDEKIGVLVVFEIIKVGKLHIILLRHGQSEANKERIMQGHLDSPLSELGKEQAKEIANVLKNNNYKFECIYSSDLSRAKETAEIIGKELNNQKIIFDSRLRELYSGELEGRKVESLTIEEENYLNSCWKDHSKKVFGGETVAEMTQRIKEIFEEIINTHKNESMTLVIAHGGTIYHILNYILKIFPETEEWFSNCSYNMIEGPAKTLENWRLIIFNGNKMKE